MAQFELDCTRCSNAVLLCRDFLDKLSLEQTKILAKVGCETSLQEVAILPCTGCSTVNFWLVECPVMHEPAWHALRCTPGCQTSPNLLLIWMSQTACHNVPVGTTPVARHPSARYMSA